MTRTKRFISSLLGVGLVLGMMSVAAPARATAGVTEYQASSNNGQIGSIVRGSDGALWYTENNVGMIGRITTSGAFTEYVVPAPAGSYKADPEGITAGSDGAL